MGGRRRPVIGITAGGRNGRPKGAIATPDKFIAVRPEYAKAVADSGGLPVVLPAAVPGAAPEKYLEIIDGLLIPGGADIIPSFYGEKDRFQLGEKVPAERTRFEIGLIKGALANRRKEIPVIAICYGMQLVNVALGGSLYQDLSEVESINTGSRETTPCEIRVDHRGGGRKSGHKVFFADTAGHPLLDRICRAGAARPSCRGKNGFTANTSHHQAVREPLPSGLHPFARSADGIVEGFFMEGRRFFIGLQWHPERQMESEFSRALFSAFLREANGKK